MHSQLWGTVTAPRPGWTGVPKHRGLLGVPAGLTTRNAGLTQTLPSQRYFLACWGLEKKSQASDFAQEVQPSLSSSRCSPPPPWTHPSTSFASCISAQPVSLRSLAWGHALWEGLESAAALAARRPQVGNEQDPGFIPEWPGLLASLCWVARPSTPTLGPGHLWGAGQGKTDGCCSHVSRRLWESGGGAKLRNSQRRLPTTKLQSEASDLKPQTVPRVETPGRGTRDPV